MPNLMRLSCGYGLLRWLCRQRVLGLTGHNKSDPGVRYEAAIAFGVDMQVSAK